MRAENYEDEDEIVMTEEEEEEFYDRVNVRTLVFIVTTCSL